jgi:hypothetical protein
VLSGTERHVVRGRGHLCDELQRWYLSTNDCTKQHFSLHVVSCRFVGGLLLSDVSPYILAWGHRAGFAIYLQTMSRVVSSLSRLTTTHALHFTIFIAVLCPCIWRASIRCLFSQVMCALCAAIWLLRALEGRITPCKANIPGWPVWFVRSRRGVQRAHLLRCRARLVSHLNREFIRLICCRCSRLFSMSHGSPRAIVRYHVSCTVCITPHFLPAFAFLKFSWRSMSAFCCAHVRMFQSTVDVYP